MKRPRGVIILACIFLLAAIGMAYGSVRYMSEILESPSSIAVGILNFVIVTALGIGLFKLRNWARWAVIAVGVYWLLLLPREVHEARVIVDFAHAGMRTLFCVCAIWYLSRPKIKAAFSQSMIHPRIGQLPS